MYGCPLWAPDCYSCTPAGKRVHSVVIGMLGGVIGMLGGVIGMLGGVIGMLGGVIGMLGGVIGMMRGVEMLEHPTDMSC